VLALTTLLCPALAAAGYTETAPAQVFVVEERIVFSSVSSQWNNRGEQGPLIDEVVRYEPGGGLQGTIIPNVEASFTILVNMLAYGITDSVTAMVAVPVVLENRVEPRLGWRTGDYSTELGRTYSANDFWTWAASMGQPKPSSWHGNEGGLGDIVFGGRWRFGDHLSFLRGTGLTAALTGYGSLRTGAHPDPEQIVAAGTSSWDLHAQGELGAHLGMDFEPRRFFDRRLSVGVDLFYEAFLPQTRRSGTGAIHPLLLNQRPFVGKRYTLDPGDFFGASVGIDGVVWRGPAWETWLTRRSGISGDTLPPVLSLGVTYTWSGIAQSDWESDSALWDWEQERFWRPGYKNIFFVTAMVSLLRVGVPVQLNLGYRNLTWLPGKNARAPDVFYTGVRVPLRFW
jgi:hypothetical protein